MKASLTELGSLLPLAVVLAAACSAAPNGNDDPSNGNDDAANLGQALDDKADPDDGKACYQDVPMRKGVMSYGVCCFDDPKKGTSECIICDAAHTCTKGGATPGALTAQGGLVVSTGTVLGVNGGGTWKPPNNVVGTVAPATNALTKQP